MTTEYVDEKSYLIFAVGEENYAVEVYTIEKIVQEFSITKLPDMPPYILGLMNLRGRVIPVIDAQSKIGLGPITDNEDTRIIVFRNNFNGKERFVALKVSAAKEVRRISNQQLMTPPEGSQSKTNQSVLAVIEEGDHYIMLIDQQQSFSLREDDLTQIDTM